MTGHNPDGESFRSSMNEHQSCESVDVFMEQFERDLGARAEEKMLTCDGHLSSHLVKLLRRRRIDLKARALVLDCWQEAQSD
jgi:hypothetical protein